jgi:CRISPR-associated endonuclease Cas2
MARPRKKEYSLAEKLALLKAKGISETEPILEEDLLPELNERIAQILRLVKTSPIKSTEMTYLIMYDITDNKVRIQVAKYLLKAGCIRIQKSVFLLRSENARFPEIYDTLKEVNSYYENKDSIILVPVNASDVRSMKLIGKNINIAALTDKPNTLFF